MSAVSPKEVRAARAFLQTRHVSSSIVHPRKFASAAKEMSAPFKEVLSFIMRIYQGQTNQAAKRRELLRGATGGDQG